ncbi:MerR family transcriptional regulator [Saccharibacillus sp. CPCC 101409]|uniref:MerR family transcriptional regulator n=1 Tax=Saccharibacillus sp. CPCC 101409 TaxID=3058041 RepID=UPI002673C618|nr:MerR family transcriptional regulator [Saccharibacillus sp. CPCC 101409]MDO3412826.1 MerR family transcriptional regulator [Saccharibacillus sp. CPCC 101409]
MEFIFTIGQTAKKIGINIGAIRFYERKGLLEAVERDENNNRLYSDYDIGWLHFIKCLRATGMSVEEIKSYYELVKTGISTLPERTRLIEDQRKKLLEEIEVKRVQLVHLDEKLERYYRGENY